MRNKNDALHDSLIHMGLHLGLPPVRFDDHVISVSYAVFCRSFGPISAFGKGDLSCKDLTL